MKPLSISRHLARSLAVKAQLLDEDAKIDSGKNGILQIVDQLGYIQIDTISIIQRSHHHTLWTRHANYREELLDELQSKDRAVFEYWGHAMSYLPMSDYRFALPKMKKFRNPRSPWVKHQSEKCGHLLKPVLDRIRNEGPLGAKDFAPPPGRKGGTWWDWKPAKVALELLFWRGELMISKREKFQKVYDLTERVIPNHIDTSLPTEEELGGFLVNRALQALGIASEKDVRRFLQAESARDSDMQIASNEAISRSLNNLIEAGQVIQVSLKGDNSLLYYMHSTNKDNVNSAKTKNSNVYLLSPFDNLIIQRDRLKRIFDFDYAVECYLPPAKRSFGYFTLPILWGLNFVGKIDPKADRKNKTLVINNLLVGQSVVDSEDFLSSLAKSIAEFTRFNQCESVKIVKLSPAKLKPVLNRMIKKFLVSNK